MRCALMIDILLAQLKDQRRSMDSEPRYFQQDTVLEKRVETFRLIVQLERCSL